MNPPVHHALITGAGSGIGKSLCAIARRGGTKVCAVDRFFGDVTSDHADNLPADVSAVDFVERLRQRVTHQFDLVIHCAAISAVGRFERLDAQDVDHVMRTNLLAPIRITRDLTRHKLLAQDATHVFVASMSCFTGYPGAAAYAASKDGIMAFARCFRVAHGRTGGNVITVFPGPTDTPHAARYSPDNSRKDRRANADAVADVIWRATQRRKSTAFTTVWDRMGAVVASLLPGTATRLMGQWLLPQLDATERIYTDNGVTRIIDLPSVPVWPGLQRRDRRSDN